MLYDPLTGTASGTGRQPFPTSNLIPASPISPISAAILKDIVAPTLPGFNNNYFSTIDYVTDYAKYDGKFTWVADSKTTVNARFGYATSYELGSPLLPSVVPGPNPIQQGRIWDTSVHSHSVAVTRVVSSTFVLDGVFGVTRNDMLATPESSTCWGDTFGIKNACQARLRERD